LICGFSLLSSMPSLIKILPDHVINKIAAGEVVERPASVVKELVENSLDAGASEITVDIEQAGRRMIRVTDDGSGMSGEDARMAFERHATNKIVSDGDLEAIRTMGFRGEALSSIASVSQVRMITAKRGSPAGILIEIEGGMLKAASEAAAPSGTSMEIAHLFFNTPARLKFLKSPATEFSHIVTALSRLAMAHPGVRFRLLHNKKQVLDLPASQSLRERTFQLYGAEIADQMAEFSGGRDAIRVYGLLGRPGVTRADRTYQDFYVNGRAIRNASLTHALYGAHGDMLMRDRHPMAFVFISIDPALVDVNVHPAKAEVRFRNQPQVHDLVRDVIREGLRGQAMHAGQQEPGASTVRAESVGEALAAYGTGRMNGANERSYPSVLYGRRKSDLGPDQPRDPGAAGAAQASAVQQRLPGEDLVDILVPIAQIHSSFIIAQSRDGMAMIDQHAAHERVLFEKLQDQFSAGDIQLQDLLVPLPVEVGPAQAALLAEHIPELGTVGFIVEDFGNGTFMIKTVPALLVGADHKRLLLDILDEVGLHGTSGRAGQLRDEILSVMACHPAIKVHRKLDFREMERLLTDLSRCRMPHTCPHGRPTMVRFSVDDIRKMFKRI